LADGLGLLWVQVSEAFLQRVMALYTAAHYKNQVNAPLPLY
jgi:tRNA(Met) C34 N-acetyltransferase TmcA